ncbi:MAG: S8/S53 family peptidase [Bacteroidota bacterium]
MQQDSGILLQLPEQYLILNTFFLDGLPSLLYGLFNQGAPATTVEASDEKTDSSEETLFIFEKVIGYKYLFKEGQATAANFVKYYQNELAPESLERKLHRWYRLYISEEILERYKLTYESIKEKFQEAMLGITEEIIDEQTNIGTYSLFDEQEPYRPFQYFFTKMKIDSLWERVDPIDISSSNREPEEESTPDTEPQEEVQSELIAIIDSGIQFDHLELEDQYYPVPVKWSSKASNRGYNALNKDFDNVSDDNGHGTFIAGLVSALINGKQVRGIIPNFKIINIKAFPDGRSNTLAEAIFFAVKQKATVINCSWGAEFHEKEQDELLNDAFEFAFQNDCICVCAAGNQGNDVKGYFPANFENSITVGATNKMDVVMPASNYGEGVDVFAPGEAILSLSLDPKRRGEIRSGTSFAAPLISGVIAGMLILHPDLKERIKKDSRDLLSEIKKLLKKEAAPIRSLGTIGKDVGRIDVYQFLEATYDLDGSLPPL